MGIKLFNSFSILLYSSQVGIRVGWPCSASFAVVQSPPLLYSKHLSGSSHWGTMIPLCFIAICCHLLSVAVCCRLLLSVTICHHLLPLSAAICHRPLLSPNHFSPTTTRSTVSCRVTSNTPGHVLWLFAMCRHMQLHCLLQLGAWKPRATFPTTEQLCISTTMVTGSPCPCFDPCFSDFSLGWEAYLSFVSQALSSLLYSSSTTICYLLQFALAVVCRSVVVSDYCYSIYFWERFKLLVIIGLLLWVLVLDIGFVKEQRSNTVNFLRLV